MVDGLYLIQADLGSVLGDGNYQASCEPARKTQVMTKPVIHGIGQFIIGALTNDALDLIELLGSQQDSCPTLGYSQASDATMAASTKEL